MPAYQKGMARQRLEIKTIVDNTEAANFENSIETLERSGALLTEVSNVFDILKSAHTNDKLQKIAKKVAPLLSKHKDDIRLNEKLFHRIKTVHEQKDNLSLSVEQKKLLEEYFRNFVRGGANLSATKKEKLRTINTELSLLSLQFGENVLAENKIFELVIDKEENLIGLPEAVKTGGIEAAKEKGYESKWLFTLDKPSLNPFLQYSEKRDLREKMFKADINRGNNNNKLDNKIILSKIAALRVNKAKLLGYDTHAHFILEKNMAKAPDNVYGLLNQLWEPALKMAKIEAAEIQTKINKEGKNFRLEPWDWLYYAEKVKKAKYAIDDELLRPYFKLENVREGAFAVANKLYGITFEQRSDIPLYHKDIEVFEVKEADGSHLGILFTDYFPRPGKQGGAWMNSFRKQSRQGGKNITPVICNVCNFSKPTGNKPALLTLEEVFTLFHEFGHALHGLLSNSTYNSLSGTSVPRDFVELPSQIMENWATDAEVLRMYAKHYTTEEVIPQTLIDKIKNARRFNQGFATVEYLAAAFLDMDWHTLTEAKEQNCMEFENSSMKNLDKMPEIAVRYRSPYFQHIFSGGYSSGYYSYIWAEVLDADAFQLYEETDIFDQKTAKAFRINILEKGGTEDPMILYKRFRGSEPKITALLKKRGLENNEQ